MFSRSLLVHASVVFAVSFIASSCVDKGSGGAGNAPLTQQGREIKNFLPQLVGGVIGQASYVNIPGFYEKLAPLIIDQGQFDSFLRKYEKQSSLSEKDKIDILIQLGFIQNAPQWLTPKANVLIDKYYPGLRTKATSIGFSEKKLASIQTSYISSYGETDLVNPQLAMAQLAMESPAPVLGQAATLEQFADAIGFIDGIGADSITPAFARLSGAPAPLLVGGSALLAGVITGKLLTEAAINAIIEHKEAVCNALGGCVRGQPAELIMRAVGQGTPCPPCSPPNGSMCYEVNSGHSHNGWDPHYHLWLRNQEPETCTCHWNKLAGTRGTTETEPVGITACQSYQSWPGN